MLRSHLERGPGPDPVEFIELKIWASSEGSPGFERALSESNSNRVPSEHLQDPSPSVADSGRSLTQCSTRLPICRISGWPRAVNAISSAGHLRGGVGPGWMHVPRESSYFWAGFGRGAREVQNRWKSSQLFNSTWKCNQYWAIPKFWQKSHRSPHEFTNCSWLIAIFCHESWLTLLCHHWALQNMTENGWNWLKIDNSIFRS